MTAKLNTWLSFLRPVGGATLDFSRYQHTSTSTMLLELAQAIDPQASKSGDVVTLQCGSTKFSLFPVGAFVVLAKGREVINRFSNDPANKFTPLTKSTLKETLARFAPAAAAIAEPDRKPSSTPKA